MLSKIVTKKLTAKFKTTFFLIFALSLLTIQLSAGISHAAIATLSWTPPTNYAGGATIQDFVGYNVYLGTSSGSYTQKIDVGDLTSYTVNNLTDGTTYYFALTAYDSMGNESGYSSEVNNGGASSNTTTPTLYTISASAGAGGTISPSGSVALSQGASQTFTIAPSAGYTIAGVTVDGTSVGAVASYTFSNVTANHTIAASFAASTYTLIATASTGGTITPSGATTLASGGSQTYTITPAAGYHISGVTVDGTLVGSVSTYTFSNVVANHTISASFVINTYSITGTAGSGGTISPAGTTNVNSGGSQTYTITPAAGYSIAAVTVDGTPVGAVSSYTFSNVTANHTIGATFSLNSSYSITASVSGKGGSISPAGSTTVPAAGSLTYTITPATGYRVSAVTVDGVSVGAVSSYTFSNVTANHSITAKFSKR
ncbi:MAG TPA: fibronectin type III domain-containing protein [Geomonas sp.]|nr:fibronectin type III domain-containing protein [Geomonas sp.]